MLTLKLRGWEYSKYIQNWVVFCNLFDMRFGYKSLINLILDQCPKVFNWAKDINKGYYWSV